MRKIAALLVCLLLLCGCTQKVIVKELNEFNQQVTEIEKIENKDILEKAIFQKTIDLTMLEPLQQKAKKAIELFDEKTYHARVLRQSAQNIVDYYKLVDEMIAAVSSVEESNKLKFLLEYLPRLQILQDRLDQSNQDLLKTYESYKIEDVLLP